MAGLASAVHFGPMGYAATIPAAIGRRYGANAMAVGARAAREAIESGTAGALIGRASDAARVVDRTAQGIAAKRKAGDDNVSATATTVPETVAALTHLERNNQVVRSRVASGVSTLVRGGVKGERTSAGEVAPGVTTAFAKPLENASKQFAKRVENVQRLATNLEHLHGTLTAQADALQDHAPNVTQAMQIASARAVSFLAAKVPHHPPMGIAGAEWEPSQTEISTFTRYYEATENPAGVLKQAAAGTLTPEAVEAVQTVYPALYRHIQEAVVEKLASRHGAVPYQSRLMLSMLTGLDVDGSATGPAIAANQAALVARRQEKQQQVKDPGPSTLTLGARTRPGNSGSTA